MQARRRSLPVWGRALLPGANRDPHLCPVDETYLWIDAIPVPVVLSPEESKVRAAVRRHPGTASVEASEAAALVSGWTGSVRAGVVAAEAHLEALRFGVDAFGQRLHQQLAER